MYCLRLNTSTVYSFIGIGSSLKEELQLQDMWTDRQIDKQGDSYVFAVFWKLSFLSMIIFF